MIKNFEELKKQLAELADVLNTFKSEAVQVRLLELIFHASHKRSVMVRSRNRKQRSVSVKDRSGRVVSRQTQSTQQRRSPKRPKAEEPDQPLS